MNPKQKTINQTISRYPKIMPNLLESSIVSDLKISVNVSRLLQEFFVGLVEIMTVKIFLSPGRLVRVVLLNLDGAELEQLPDHHVVGHLETDAGSEAGFQEIELNFNRPRVHCEPALVN